MLQARSKKTSSSSFSAVRQKRTKFQRISELRQAQLVTEQRDGQLIALGQGVGTDQVVRLLVERGMPVYEIAPAEETLESFYLSLMNDQRGGVAPVTQPTTA